MAVIHQLCVGELHVNIACLGSHGDGSVGDVLVVQAVDWSWVSRPLIKAELVRQPAGRQTQFPISRRTEMDRLETQISPSKLENDQGRCSMSTSGLHICQSMNIYVHEPGCIRWNKTTVADRSDLLGQGSSLEKTPELRLNLRS